MDVSHQEKISLPHIEQNYSYIHSILYYSGTKAQIKNFEFLKENIATGQDEANPHFIKNLGLKLTITSAIVKETGHKGQRRNSTHVIAQNLINFGFKEENFKPGPADNEVYNDTSSESMYSKSSDAKSNPRLTPKNRQKRRGFAARPGDA